MATSPEQVADLWKANQDAYQALEVIRDRLKEVATRMQDAKGDRERFGPLDQEFHQVHREWDHAFAIFMRTNELFREATARLVDEHGAETLRIRNGRPPA